MQPALQHDGAKPDAADSAQSNGTVAAPAAAVDGEAALEGVPPLPPCRVRLVWEEDAGRAAQVCRDPRSGFFRVCSRRCTTLSVRRGHQVEHSLPTAWMRAIADAYS